MTPAGHTQLDFLEHEEAAVVAAENPRRMALVIDHRRWMGFLAEEWLFSNSAGIPIRLSTGQARSSEENSGRILIQVWFDLCALPVEQVFALRGGDWVEAPIDGLLADDTEVAWPGPLPLFAVDKFCVRSRADADRLTAMAQGFANIELPTQAIEVASFDVQPASDWPPLSNDAGGPPELWNAMRGAAAMATWAVPAIDPWLDVLCASLSDTRADTRMLEKVHAPWWCLAPWQSEDSAGAESPPLWRAMLFVLARSNPAKELQAREKLAAICELARTLGEDASRLDLLMQSTSDLLADRKTLEQVASDDDVLGLALQLVLLRPRPEQYATWKDDWPAMPPGAWWTGATLSGLLCGYRALDCRFRGSSAARRLLALRTWRLGEARPKSRAGWPAMSIEVLDWIASPNAISLRANGNVWAERGASNRGLWYRADMNDPEIAEHVEALAEEFRPSLFRRFLRVSNARVPIRGSGVIEIEDDPPRLVIEGAVELAFDPAMITEVSRLDGDAFRDWLATSTVPHRLPRPPVLPRRLIVAEQAAEFQTSTLKRSPAKLKKLPLPSSAVPEGLVVRENFLSEQEEIALLQTIDQATWSKVLSRKVQHYGWTYDYRSRKVESKGYLGPLPAWAHALASRLFSEGLLHEMPDQVIVNEYLGEQGISRHTDCPECFRGPIATVSLNEAWEMVFHRKEATGKTSRYAQVLPRGSVAILSGASRSEWTHEIPKRKKEAGVLRVRRVSVTFRKVNAEAPVP